MPWWTTLFLDFDVLLNWTIKLPLALQNQVWKNISGEMDKKVGSEYQVGLSEGVFLPWKKISHPLRSILILC